mgnify:CR=1 FL=1
MKGSNEEQEGRKEEQGGAGRSREEQGGVGIVEFIIIVRTLLLTMIKSFSIFEI